MASENRDSQSSECCGFARSCMCGAVEVTNELEENVDYRFVKDLFHH